MVKHESVATPLAETYTLTEARGEASDPDRDIILAETQTVTKTMNESRNDDQGAWAHAAQWQHGERRPLLFRNAVAASAELPDFEYDRALAMSVNEKGEAVVRSAALSETFTHTAHRTESDDADR